MNDVINNQPDNEVSAPVYVPEKMFIIFILVTSLVTIGLVISIANLYQKFSTLETTLLDEMQFMESDRYDYGYEYDERPRNITPGIDPFNSVNPSTPRQIYGYSFSPDHQLFELILLAKDQAGNYITDNTIVAMPGNRSVEVEFPAHDPTKPPSRVTIDLVSATLSPDRLRADRQNIESIVHITNHGPSTVYVNYGDVVRYKVDNKWYETNTYEDEDFSYEFSDTAPYILPFSSDIPYRFSASIPKDASQISLVYAPQSN